MARQCTNCTTEPLIDVNAIQNSILRLYGPSGSNQVLPGNLYSFSFQTLADFLTPVEQILPSPTPTLEVTEETEATPEEIPTTPSPPLIQTALENADWIIFAMLDIVSDQEASDAVKTFLAERPDIASRTKLVVLAMNAPYYLDTTDISKLTAYYGVYSKIDPFIETAVKTLFQQINAHGASPVSIGGIGYDLITATSPDPGQIIQLYYDQEQETGGESNITTTPSGLTDLRVGDSLQLKTGVILDHNGNQVPDGTPVQFTISYLSEGLGFDVPQPEVPTVNGVARIDILLDRPGQLQIKASSGEARASVGIAVTVFEDQPPIFEEITPTPTDTPTPVPPTPTESPTPIPPTFTPTSTVTPSPTPSPIIVPHIPYERRVGLDNLAAALIGVLSVGGAGYLWGKNTGRSANITGVRLGLITIIAGLIAYNYYALGFPGSGLVQGFLGGWSACVFAWIAGILTMLIGLYWINHQRY